MIPIDWQQQMVGKTLGLARQSTCCSVGTSVNIHTMSIFCSFSNHTNFKHQTLYQVGCDGEGGNLLDDRPSGIERGRLLSANTV